MWPLSTLRRSRWPWRTRRTAITAGFDPRTAEIAFWTSDAGIDGENGVDLDELDLILMDPRPASVWCQDMVDFADGISDRAAGERLHRSLRGKGAFRRFKNEFYQRHPDLISAPNAFKDARTRGH